MFLSSSSPSSYDLTLCHHFSSFSCLLQTQPLFELRCSNNVVHLHTCADSCAALVNMLQYLVSQGDLHPPPRHASPTEIAGQKLPVCNVYSLENKNNRRTEIVQTSAKAEQSPANMLLHPKLAFTTPSDPHHFKIQIQDPPNIFGRIMAETYLWLNKNRTNHISSLLQVINGWKLNIDFVLGECHLFYPL